MLIINCNDIMSEMIIPGNFKGFNYAGFVIPKNKDQYIVIKTFEEKSEDAWLDTGIIF